MIYAIIFSVAVTFGVYALISVWCSAVTRRRRRNEHLDRYRARVQYRADTGEPSLMDDRAAVGAPSPCPDCRCGT